MEKLRIVLKMMEKSEKKWYKNVENWQKIEVGDNVYDIFKNYSWEIGILKKYKKKLIFQIFQVGNAVFL